MEAGANNSTYSLSTDACNSTDHMAELETKHIGSLALCAFSLAAGIGIVTNRRSAVHIKRKFDTRKTIFFLIFLDAIVSFFACLAALPVSIIMHFYQSFATCSSLFLLVNGANACRLLLTAEVAVIR